MNHALGFLTRRIPLAALLALAIVTFAAPSMPALETGAYSMEILVNGHPLREYDAREATYVEAIQDAEYGVRLANHTAERVAVALAVDGLNSIDAKTTTTRAASKWILGPYETVTLYGWQTSTDKARRFFFTTEDESYGAWLGNTDNLGIISAAFFREKRTRPIPYGREGARRRDQDSPAPCAPTGRAESSKKAEAESGLNSPELSDEHAATGIGSEIDHRVRRVTFRAQDHPAAVVEIRYEYRDALISLGVLPRFEKPIARRERARGFDESGFAPDPYRR